MPPGKHMVSMAASTLGKPGLLTAWLSYLFLLYTLLSAYISGGSDIFSNLLFHIGLNLKDWQASVLFTLLFGFIVYGGIHFVDYTNRVLMFAKLAIYCLLVIFIAPYIEFSHFHQGDIQYIGGAIMILITSFGFAIIVPNLRDYFNDDVQTLKKVILIGSLIPLICYLAWDAVIMGALPPTGSESLASLTTNPHATSSLAHLLTFRVHNNTINALFHFFTSICMLTAFLGFLYAFIVFWPMD